MYSQYELIKVHWSDCTLSANPMLYNKSLSGLEEQVTRVPRKCEHEMLSRTIQGLFFTDTVYALAPRLNQVYTLEGDAKHVF